MKHNSLLLITSLITALIFAACTMPLPEPAEPAAEAVAVEESDSEAEEPSGEPTSFAVDATASELIWIGSNIVGQEQTGTIDIAEGSLEFAGTTLTGGSVSIDMTTMSSINLSGDTANNLIGHLMNEDFFEVDTWPTSMLVFKSAEATDVEAQYLVTADLTIKDVTDELTFITDVIVDEGMLTATADIAFDRTDWGVIYGSGNFFDGLGDRVIQDEVIMQVTLVASSS
ncbi:MAG: YceI family protein [Chloroflexota bacterium]